MEIISGTTEYIVDGDCAVTLGKFDGVHRGHRELIDRVIAKKKDGLKAVIFTFDKSPAEFFSGRVMPALTTREEKHRIFEYLGVDVLIELPFNKETAATDPVDFIKDYLVNKTGAKHIVVGTDASFGDRGKGNADLIEKMAKECGYTYEIVEKILVDGDEVSSTLIREYVSDGHMEKVMNLIGVPYAIRGEIVRGNQIGRTIGFPTINIEIKRDKLMPPFGVYFAEISIEGVQYNGITNVGTKPTITEDKTVFAETNILDFEGDIYGKNASVKLLHFSRPEMKFSSIDELQAVISNDIKNGKAYFA